MELFNVMLVSLEFSEDKLLSSITFSLVDVSTNKLKSIEESENSDFVGVEV